MHAVWDFFPDHLCAEKLILCIFHMQVVSSYAQVAAELPEAKIALPSCLLPIGKREAVDTDDIARKLNSGELSAEGEDDTAAAGIARGPTSLLHARPRCENGPVTVTI